MYPSDSGPITKNEINFNGTTEERIDTIDMTNSKARKIQMAKMDEVTIKHKSPQPHRKEKKINDNVQLKPLRSNVITLSQLNIKSPRKDHNGIEIISKNKRKVKVSYLDKVSSNDLIEIIPIESFKSYNVMANFGSLKDVYMKSRSNCSCLIY